jgi:hypothetical protein
VRDRVIAPTLPPQFTGRKLDSVSVSVALVFGRHTGNFKRSLQRDSDKAFFVTAMVDNDDGTD